MKKVIISLALVVVIAIAIGAYYILTNLDAIVKAAIEKYGSQATQTAVRVEKVHIDLKQGTGAIQGLTVANPKGFALSHAFSLGEIKTGIEYASLKEEPYVIKEITVRAPQVFVEINDEKKTNLNELKNNLSAAVPSKGTKEPAGEQKPGAEPRLIIKKLLFTDGDIQAKVVPLNNKEYKLKLPTINMANLGGSKGATPTELAKEILDRLIAEAKKQIKEKGIDAEVAKLKAKAEERIEEEKAKAKAKVEEEKAKAKEKADTKVEEEKQKAAEKLKGLLN